MLTPLATEVISSGEGAIPADDDEPVDALIDEVLGCPVAPVILTKLGTSRRPDGGAALTEDGGYGRPIHLLDELPTPDGTIPPLQYREGLSTCGQGRAHNSSNRGIHSRRVPTGSEDPESVRLPGPLADPTNEFNV